MIETLGDIIRNNAYKFADESAFVYHGRTVTFSDHHERCQQVASALSRAGIRRQDRVSVLSQNKIEFLELYGAVELAGFILTTVNFRLAPPEIEYIVNDSQPRILFFEAPFTQTIDGLRDRLPTVDMYVSFGHEAPALPSWAVDYDTFVDSGDAIGAPHVSTPDDIMHLIYTSGTTGRPKGVVRPHSAEMEVASLMATEIGVLVSDRMQLMMPLFHVGSRFLQLGAHLRGATVVLHYQFDPEDILRTIERERATITHMAPTMFQGLLDEPVIDDVDLSSLHTLVYSAAPMSVSLLKRGLERLGPVFLQLYGMTEGGGTTLHKRQHKPEGSEKERRRLGSIGQAAPTVDIKIIDDDGKEQPTGEPGEILTRTPTHLSGYWNNSVATIEALRDGWYHTGDVGYLDEDGFLFLVDRKKDVIISGAENIYSREVEEAVASHPMVVDVAVIGLPDDYWGETVAAVVVAKDGQAPETQALIDHCKTQIASYKKPKTVFFVDDLPRLPSGKVNKVVLRDRYRQGTIE
ncbi:MAG: long-chain-fatty-acid--CoA ligase [Alphaproteobacteria bacterium]|nr:long-chain-fatty-acid--CoA ligase [Alphaproteobacteria bacterium]